jgi:hypothetical protein
MPQHRVGAGVPCRKQLIALNRGLCAGSDAKYAAHAGILDAAKVGCSSSDASARRQEMTMQLCDLLACFPLGIG